MLLQIRQNSTRCFFLLYMPRSVGSWRISGGKVVAEGGTNLRQRARHIMQPDPPAVQCSVRGGIGRLRLGRTQDQMQRAAAIAAAGIPTALEQRSPRSRWRCQHAQPIPRAKFWRFTDKKCRCAAAATQWSIWWDIVQEIRKYILYCRFL